MRPPLIHHLLTRETWINIDQCDQSLDVSSESVDQADLPFVGEQRLSLAWQSPFDFHLALADHFPQHLPYLIDGPYFAECLRHNDKREFKVCLSCDKQ